MRFVCALVLAVLAGSPLAQPSSPLPPSRLAPCEPAPSSWKLGKQFTFEELDKQLAQTHKGWQQYRKTRRASDVYREFSEGRTRGFAVFRGNCLSSYFVTASR